MNKGPCYTFCRKDTFIEVYEGETAEGQQHFILTVKLERQLRFHRWKHLRNLVIYFHKMI